VDYNNVKARGQLSADSNQPTASEAGSWQRSAREGISKQQSAIGEKRSAISVDIGLE
jgi:hypothetical protein